MDPPEEGSPLVDVAAVDGDNVVDTVSASILTTSENVNNENREIELRLTAAGSRRDADADDDATEADSTTAAATTDEAAEPDDSECDESAVVEQEKEEVELEPIDDDEFAKHVRYNEHQVAIYTDPNTGEQFQYERATQEWLPAIAENRISADASCASSSTENPYENQHYRWCHDTKRWIAKAEPVAEDGEGGNGVDTTTSANETEFYKYDATLRAWIPKAFAHSVTTTVNPDETDPERLQHTYTDADGAVFFWDGEKKAWFPRIDDDFMAKYQMSYGNYVASDDEEEEEELLEKLLASRNAAALGEVVPSAAASGAAETKQAAKRKAQPGPSQWFDLAEEKNTKVYVSNLPTDITEPEFIELMSKYGMIFREPGSDKVKVKLYAGADGQLKGDGLCDYIRIESVEMALKLMDGMELRGKTIHVQRAKFQMRGEYNPTLRKHKKKKDKEKIKKMQEKLFDWRPEKMRGERSKHERTVIIKNLFDPEQFEREVQLIIDYQSDLREECAKCGTVRKVVVYDKHAEGVASVIMSSPEEADVVVQMMNKRFFGQRQLVAELWDGKVKYKIEETAGDASKRLSNWDVYLESDDRPAEEDTTEVPE